MIHQECIEILLKKNPMFNKIYKRLLTWDETKTIKENSIIQGISILYARNFKTKYNLNYKRIKNTGNSPNKLKSLAYKELKENGWTFENIAKLFNVSRQTIQQKMAREN